KGPDWLPALGKLPVPAGLTCMARAGQVLYTGAPGRVQAIELSQRGLLQRVSWEASVEGTPGHLAVCDGLLLVSTREGKILAFGPDRVKPLRHPAPPPPPSPVHDEAEQQAGEVLRAGAREGYGV